MAQIPTAPYGLPFRAVKGSHIGEIESLIRPQRAAAQLGESIAGFGAKLAEQALERNANREFAEFKGFVNDQMSQMRDFANSNPDFNEYQGQWTQGHVKNIEQRLEGMSRRGREAAGNWWRMYGETYQSQVDTWVRDGMKRQAMISGFDELDRIPFRNYEVEAAAETARRKAQNPNAPTVTEQEIQLAEATKILDSLSFGADPAILPYQRDTHLRLFKAKQEAVATQGEADALFAGLVRDHTDPISGIFDFTSATEDFNQRTGINESIRSVIEARMAQQKIVASAKLNEIQAQERDGISKAFFTKDFDTAEKLIESSHLGSEEKETKRARLRTELDIAAKGEEIITDYRTKNSLKDMASSIWAGPGLIKDLDAAVDSAITQKAIKPKDAEEIFDFARTERKAAQSQAENQARFYGIKAIVGYDIAPSPDLTGMTPEERTQAIMQELMRIMGKREKATPSEKMRWQLHDEYMQQAEQWIFDNPDKLGKEFNQWRSYWETFYRNVAELQDENLKRILEVSKKTGKSLAEMLQAEEGSPKTLEDFYDKVRQINAVDPTKAKEYYEKYKGLFE